MRIGDCGRGYGACPPLPVPKPQSPNPQSPIPNPQLNEENNIFKSYSKKY